VIAAYGNTCTCCSESTFEFLTLEHLNNDGAAHRAKVGKNGQAQLLDIKKRGFPAEYTVLCFNCNLAKGIHGSCPHTWQEILSEKDTTISDRNVPERELPTDVTGLEAQDVTEREPNSARDVAHRLHEQFMRNGQYAAAR